MKAYFDSKPKKIESIGGGAYRYRWDITQVSNEEGTQWEAEEVTVYATLSPNKITEAVICELWPPSHEQKLLNDYFATLLTPCEDEIVQRRRTAYADFLQERDRIKQQIDADCKEFGIK